MHLVAEKGQINVHGSAILCDGPKKRGINFLNYHVLDNWLCISMCAAQLDMFNLYAPFLDEQILMF